MRREEWAPPQPRRSGSVQRSGSAQRNRVPVPSGDRRSPCAGGSRVTDAGSVQSSPPSEVGSARRSPDPARIYGTSQAAEARRGGSRTPANSSSGARADRPGRPPSAGVARAGSRQSSAAPTDTFTQTAIFSYLKVYGLNQYARAFSEAGLAELDVVSRLSESEALEFLETLHVYPGHRLRLLRAVDCLRHAALGAERRDVAQLLEDDAALDRLCAHNEELHRERHETESEKQRLQEENANLLKVIRQQHDQLQKARSRISEQEDLVRAQTEQVAFLAQQLQLVAQENPARESELYRSYRDSFDDWATGEPVQLPDVTSRPTSRHGERGQDGTSEAGAEEMLKPRSFTPEDFKGANATTTASAESTMSPQRAKQNRHGSALPPFSPPRRAQLAMSLDSARVKECLAGFDVDHIIRCLGVAIQNKIILSVARAKPHAAAPELLQACAIFLEPACKERLLKLGELPQGGEGSISFCSPLMSQRGSLGQPVDPFNNIAVRTAPNQWDIYGFLRDVMVNFRLEPEVSVITLFYLDRFSEMSSVAVTPDNWQRLTITAMMLASKVWNDESFENIEFSQLCPLYTLDEINTFERTFLKCVGYNMSVKGSQYAKTYFLLRTLGAKDAATFSIAPLDELRASRLQERCLEKQIEFRHKYPEDDSTHLNWTL